MIVDKIAICKQYGITMERLNEQYTANATGLRRMHEKAVRTGKKVNNYTADQLKVLVDRYAGLSRLADEA